MKFVPLVLLGLILPLEAEPNGQAQDATAIAARIERTYGVSCTGMNATTLIDLEARLVLANRIRANYGVAVDYREVRLANLEELEARLEIVNRVRAKTGVQLDYRSQTLASLREVESKIFITERIKRTHGMTIDWQVNSLVQIQEVEKSFILAKSNASGTSPSYVNETQRPPSIPTATSVPDSGVAARSSSEVYVNGYTQKDGTYVQGYWRTLPNRTTDDNYSSKGNRNPHTGQKGSN